MVITVFGPGCARCYETERVVRRALADLQRDGDVVKVSDHQAIATAGIMATPAVAVDGVVRLAGRVPSVEEVKAWLT